MEPAAKIAEPCDCLIVGGGPAGAMLALLLAADRFRVVLVDAGRVRHTGRWETLLASSASLLERIGQGDLVRAAASPDPMRHGAIWGSDSLRWREPDSDPGLLLERGVFEQHLRRAAAAAGASVYETSIARAGDTGSWHIVGADGTRRTFRPAIAVAATGRAAIAVPAHVVECGPPTLACTVIGETDAACAHSAVVEAVRGGWTWFQSPGVGVGSVAVLLDPAGAAPLRERIRSVLCECQGPARALRDRPVSYAVAATARCVVGDEGVLRVGDAAATIDPLASQGVEKALAAADHAAAVVRTMLLQPSWRAELQREHEHWERALWRAHERRSRAFYAAERRFLDAPFWRVRAVAAAYQAPPVDEGAWYVTASDVAMVTALRRIGGRFERCEGARRRDEQFTHVGFVPIGALLAACERPGSLASATARVGRDPGCFVLPPGAVRAALEELVRRGWLTRVENAAGSP